LVWFASNQHQIATEGEKKWQKRTHLELAEYHLKKQGQIADDIILDVLRLIVTRLLERCDDPARLKQVCNIFGVPYDEKFAEAVRKAEAREELKKTLQVVDGGKKVP
jgi:hypothetical protein